MSVGIFACHGVAILWDMEKKFFFIQTYDSGMILMKMVGHPSNKASLCRDLDLNNFTKSRHKI